MKAPKVPRIFLIIWGVLLAVVSILTVVLPYYFETPLYIQAASAVLCLFFAFWGPRIVTLVLALVFPYVYLFLTFVGKEKEVEPLQGTISVTVAILWVFMVLWHIEYRKEEADDSPRDGRGEANLPPGSTVPKSGEYRCEFCGTGGLADFVSGRLKGSGIQTAQLEMMGRKETRRYFEAGKKFPECPNCGPATGWSLLKHKSSGTHGAVLTDSVICDVCGGSVENPSGHLLTTTQIVASPSYWRHFYEVKKAVLRQAGMESFSDFWRDTGPGLDARKEVAGVKAAWLVCDSCIDKFKVDRFQTRCHAEKWWSSGRTFEPPGCGPAETSATRTKKKDTSNDVARHSPPASPAVSAGPTGGRGDPVCPGCGTVYSRPVVISLLKQITPETFLFDSWSTSFRCKKCPQIIPISGNRGE